MERIEIAQFKAKWLSILQRVKRTGKPILVTRFGKPIAEIAPPPACATGASWIGSFQSRGRIVGDILEPATEGKDGVAPRHR